MNKKIILNYYRDLTKICDCCGFPIMWSVSSWAKRCRLPGNTKERSPCQKFKDAQVAKVARNKAKNEGRIVSYQNKAFNNTSHEALRECLRCEPDENGVVPKFLSKGPYNRICDRCSRIHEGVDVGNLSRIGEKIESISFAWD